MDARRRRFLQISAVTAAVLANESILFAQTTNLQEHIQTYNTYKTKLRFIRGDLDKKGRYKDYDIWVNNSIVTRENLNSNYLQVNLNQPDYKPRGETTASGHSACMYAQDRLMYPMKRVGERGEGKWEQLDWESATMEIAQNIWDLMIDSNKGANSILLQIGKSLWGESKKASAIRFANLLGIALKEETTQNEIVKLSQLYKSDLVIFWGYNPMESNIPEAHFIQECRYKGTKVITITPEYNQTAKCSDLWIPIKSGSDDVLVMNLIYEVLDNSWQKTKITQFNKNDLKEYISKKTEKITQINPSIIKNLAKDLANSKNPKIIFGNGYKTRQNIKYLKSLLGIVDAKQKQENIFEFLSDFDGKYKAREKDEVVKDMVIITASSIFNKQPKEFKATFLQKTKFIVCIDTKVSESVLYSDIALPAKWIYESWDIYKSQNKIDKLLISKPPIELETIGASKDEWSIFTQIAEKLEYISNKEKNIELSKIEDEIKYTTSGFHDLSTVYQEYINKKDVLNPLGTDEFAYNLIRKKIVENETVNMQKMDAQTKNNQNIEILPSLEPKVSKFPYSFIIKKSKWNKNTNYSTSTMLLRLQRGEPVVFINTITAKTKNIADAEEIRIYNDVGEFFAMAKISSSVPPDCVMIQDGWEYFMFKDRLGYSEILGKNRKNYLNIERSST